MKIPDTKDLLTRNKRTLLGGLGGAIAGLAYWYFIGCSSGSCAITSNPLNSTVYFAVIGLLLGSTFKEDRDQKEKS